MEPAWQSGADPARRHNSTYVCGSLPRVDRIWSQCGYWVWGTQENRFLKKTCPIVSPKTQPVNKTLPFKHKWVNGSLSKTQQARHMFDFLKENGPLRAQNISLNVCTQWSTAQQCKSVCFYKKRVTLSLSSYSVWDEEWFIKKCTILVSIVLLPLVTRPQIWDKDAFAQAQYSCNSHVYELHPPCFPADTPHPH